MLFIFIIWEALISARPVICSNVPIRCIELQGKCFPHDIHTFISTGSIYVKSDNVDKKNQEAKKNSKKT